MRDFINRYVFIIAGFSILSLSVFPNCRSTIDDNLPISKNDTTISKIDTPYNKIDTSYRLTYKFTDFGGSVIGFLNSYHNGDSIIQDTALHFINFFTKTIQLKNRTPIYFKISAFELGPLNVIAQYEVDRIITFKQNQDTAKIYKYIVCSDTSTKANISMLDHKYFQFNYEVKKEFYDGECH